MAGFDTKIVQKMANLLRARFPYIYITTWEEERAVEFVKETVSDEKTIKTVRKVYQWSQSNGFQDEDGRVRNNTSTPAQAIEFIVKNSENAVFILKDFHVYFGIDHRPIDFDVIRRLRDALPELKYAESMKNVIFISPRLVIPEDMQKEISIFDFPLPSEDELRGKLDEMLLENSSLRVLLNEEEKQQLAKSARGLTLQEAENAFARAIVTRGCLDRESLKIIFEEKNQVIKKTGILEFIQSDLGAEDIGGLENLKKWLQKRNNSWSSSAKKYNIPFFGVYNACATSMEEIIIGASMIDSKKIKNCICATSSHNLTSEKQFRNPVEYGVPKPKTATFTSTGGASILLTNEKTDIKIVSSTIGKIVDMNFKDANNVGAAMAPACCDTIYTHLTNLNEKAEDYDLILSGDLGIFGKEVLKDYMMEQYNIDLSDNYNDCGAMLYDMKTQKEITAGGSGPVCSCLVNYSYILKQMKDKKLKKVLLVTTGALYNPVFLFQKQKNDLLCNNP